MLKKGSRLNYLRDSLPWGWIRLISKGYKLYIQNFPSKTLVTVLSQIKFNILIWNMWPWLRSRLTTKSNHQRLLQKNCPQGSIKYKCWKRGSRLNYLGTPSHEGGLSLSQRGYKRYIQNLPSKTLMTVSSQIKFNRLIWNIWPWLRRLTTKSNINVCCKKIAHKGA